MRISRIAAAFAIGTAVAAPAHAADGYFFRPRPLVIDQPSAAPLAATVSGPIRIDVGGTASPFSASGGKGPYTWSATGLPTGVTLSMTGGVAASVAGNWTGLAAKVTDAKGGTATTAFSLRSVAPLSATVANPTVALTAGGSTSPFTVSGGIAPYSWASSSLPTGVTLASSGAFTADSNATVGTTASRAATVTDSEGKTATVSFSVEVTAKQGALMAAGNNLYGEVLPNQTADQFSLVSVSPATDWSSIDGGRQSACGIRSGNLYCWGLNDNGQMGLGSGSNVADGPRLISSTGWTAVQASMSAHNCGIRNGIAYCWGANHHGQLGVGDVYQRIEPTPVGGGSGTTGWSAISANGAHSCGIRNGTAYCWGYNAYGDLGIGNTTKTQAPAAVGGGSGTTGWTEISAGYFHTCGIRNGQLLCWGSNNEGALGSNGTAHQSLPQPVSGDSSGWSNLAAGFYGTCATKGGTAYCWGQNDKGQVGNGTTGNVTTGPVAVGGGAGSTGWTALAPGLSHACGIRSGALLCWGSSANGRTAGINTTSVPIQVGTSADWKAVSAGHNAVYAIR